MLLHVRRNAQIAWHDSVSRGRACCCCMSEETRNRQCDSVSVDWAGGAHLGSWRRNPTIGAPARQLWRQHRRLEGGPWAYPNSDRLKQLGAGDVGLVDLVQLASGEDRSEATEKIRDKCVHICLFIQRLPKCSGQTAFMTMSHFFQRQKEREGAGTAPKTHMHAQGSCCAQFSFEVLSSCTGAKWEAEHKARGHLAAGI